MDAQLKKLKKLTKFMQSNGVLVMRTPEMELELHPSALFRDEKRPIEATQASEDLRPEFAPEDLLLWSAPGAGYPEGN